MTEEQWLACADPGPMLEWLRARSGLRKMALFAVACCRRAWHLLHDPRSQEALRSAESFADGERSNSDLEAALDGAYEAHNAIDNFYAVGWAARRRDAADAVYEAVTACYPDGFFGADQFGARQAAHKAARASPDWKAERTSQCALLRDIIGNPFQPAPVDPAWRTATVASLAEAAYAERCLPSSQLDSARLAVLADALEEAGCADAGLLGHLRGLGPHVRGCWALDLLLGKE
jgi:hypothetical protein